MHIIVCIKQVPDTTDIAINPATNTLMREGVESILNPFDEFAMELALELKGVHRARVTALSMGPLQAERVLREALARGADDAVLLSDRAFAGSDTWATSYALSQAIRKMPKSPDLILFGKQAIDGDTAQVGPGVSEFLGMPLVTYATSLSIEGDLFSSETLMDDGVDVVQGKLPAVVTVAKGGCVPGFASLSGWMRAASAVIPCWNAVDIAADPALIGIDGSPTRVKEIFAPPVRSGGLRVEAREDAGKGVKAVFGALGLGE